MSVMLPSILEALAFLGIFRCFLPYPTPGMRKEQSHEKHSSSESDLFPVHTSTSTKSALMTPSKPDQLILLKRKELDMEYNAYSLYCVVQI